MLSFSKYSELKIEIEIKEVINIDTKKTFLRLLNFINKINKNKTKIIELVLSPVIIMLSIKNKINKENKI